MERAWQTPPPDGAFTPMHHTTAGRSAVLEAPHVPHSELIKRIIAHGLGDGPVKVVNCNFGATCQPGYEHMVKGGSKPQPAAPAGHKQRQLEGNGGSLGSSVAPIIKPPEDSEIYRRLVAANPDNSGRVYSSRYFPTTGKANVSGSVLSDFSDGDWSIDEWVRYLNSSGILGVSNVRVVSRGITMVNYSFVLNKWCERQIFDFGALRRLLLHDFGAAQRRYFPADMSLPEAMMQLDPTKSIGFFGVRLPECPKRQNKVRLYLNSGKVNFMGFPSVERARQVYDGLSRMFRDHWARLVIMKPLPDRVPPHMRAAEWRDLVRALAAHSDATRQRIYAQAAAAASGGEEERAEELMQSALSEAEEEQAIAEEKELLADELGEFADYI